MGHELIQQIFAVKTMHPVPRPQAIGETGPLAQQNDKQTSDGFIIQYKMVHHAG
jgi:hypothetical protein